MTVWLGPKDVAERLGVCRRTALSLMQEMPHSVIGGTERKTIRVSEGAFEAWMVSKSNVRNATAVTGCRKRIERRRG